MIQAGTKLNCLDNSGAYFIKCIKVLGGTRRRVAYCGDVIVVSVTKVSSKRSGGSLKIKKGDVFRAVIIQAAQNKNRRNGSVIRWDSNSAVIVDKQHEPVGTRVLGHVDRNVRDRGFTKIASMSLGVV